jgi:hypothetical protein
VESPRISSTAGGIIEDPTSSQYFTGDIPLLVESPRISSPQKLVFHWRYTSAGGHQQRYISSEILTTGRMISSVTPPAKVYIQ